MVGNQGRFLSRRAAYLSVVWAMDRGVVDTGGRETHEEAGAMAQSIGLCFNLSSLLPGRVREERWERRFNVKPVRLGGGLVLEGQGEDKLRLCNFQSYMTE